MKEKGGKRVWIISELYYPEETSTGYFLTLTAEGLTSRYDVHALCNQPTYATVGLRAAKNETRNGVSIHRCWSTTFSKDNLGLRWLNMVTISFSMLVNALMRLRSRDCVFVVTNPPTLPFMIGLACFLRRARCVLIVHDIYPEVLAAASILSPGSLMFKFLSIFSRLLYRRATRIVVLGRDMAELVKKKLPVGDDRVAVIPNWGDIDGIVPRSRLDAPLLKELKLTDKFVLQYSGNIGRVHDLESLVECAARFDGKGRIHFLFIGSGAKKEWLKKETVNRKLTNVTILDPMPRAASAGFMTACDISILSLNRGMAGISVPSRLYNIMAAGKPIIALTDSDSELARVIEEESIGWVVPPGNINRLQAVILEAESSMEKLSKMGDLARQAVVGKYSMNHAIDSYARLIDQICQ